MARVNRHTEDEELPDDDGESREDLESSPAPKKAVRKKAAPQPPAPRRRWKLYFFLVLLVGLVALGPNLIAQTPLRNYVLKVAAPRFPGSMNIGRATLAWWEPVTIEEIVVTGANGEDLLTVARVAGNTRLFDMVRKLGSVGEFRIERPVLTVVVRPDGSTLEDSLAPMSSSRRKSSGKRIDGRIEVVEGKIELTAESTQRKVSLEDVAVTIDLSSKVEEGIRTRAAARFLADGKTDAGRLTMDLTWAPGDPPAVALGTAAPSVAVATGADRVAGAQSDETLRGTVRLDGVRLESLDPVWTRLEPTLVIDGDLTADLRLRGIPAIGEQPPQIGAGGEVTVERLRVACPSLMKSDELKLSKSRVTGSIELTPHAILADHLKITTEPAQLDAHGTFPLAALADPGTWRQFWKTASSENYSLQADVDLARMASHLPHLLRIRNDVELTTGRIRATIESLEEKGERVIRGDVETSDLVARTATGTLTWPEPVVCRLTARMGTDGPVIERLAAKASFLEAGGRGTLKQARLLARCDLDRFTADVGRIIDLSEFQLSGRMSADCECRQSERDADRMIATARIGLDDFLWAAPGREPLREKRLSVDVDAEASLQEMRLSRVHTATMRVTGVPGDALTAELVRPVMIDEAAERGADVPVRVTLTGPLRRWQQRARPWVSLDGWTLDGDAELTADVVSGGDSITVSNLDGTVRSLSVAGSAVTIREQWIQLTGGAAWKRKSRQITSNDLAMNGSSLSLRADNATVTIPESGLPIADGTVALQGDLSQIARWMSTTANSPPPAYQGAVSGRIQAKSSGDSMNARFDLKIAGLTVPDTSAASTPVARSPGTPATSRGTMRNLGDLTLTGDVDYDPERDVAKLAKLTVDSEFLTLDATGTVSAASTRPWAELTGTTSYDWSSLQEMIDSLAGNGVRLTGRRKESFAYKGPLASPEPVSRASVPASNVSLPAGARPTARATTSPTPDDFWLKATGQTGLGWQTGDIYGLATGPVDLTLRLVDGAVRTTPIHIEVSGGRIMGSPTILMSPGPATLTMDKGRVVENVRFTPEMCRNWVKYVAPLLADATQIDGRFSLDLNAARVPVSAPKTGDVHGFLAVPQADVRPGPLANQIIQAARQIEVLMKRRSAEDLGKSVDPILVLHDQNVEFRLLEGRVHHRNLEIQVGDDVRIRTSGSVGLDETLALVAEVPILDEWVRREKFLAGLQGQTLRLPIGGTFQRPQIDQRAFQDLARKAASGAVTNTLEKEVGKQLDKLFNRRP